MNVKIRTLKFHLFKDKTKKAFRSESSTELVKIGVWLSLPPRKSSTQEREGANLFCWTE